MNPAMRRSSVARLQSQNSEPQIVIEGNENDSQKSHSSRQSSEDESPMNPYLLTPFGREVRKHSLPTPQCSGITASQIRRLSDRGEASPGPRQAEFLATLSQGPQVSPGGRRHSVVTISKVPPAFLGVRNRRESVAAYPGAFSSRILPNRRESIACPPSSESRGSIHNLQLDIMDDIVQARKVRMKVWNTSNEKLCEVQPIDEGPSSAQRYSSNSGRRFSDFVGTTLPPIPSSSKRRASELPPLQSTSKQKSGIVCTNTDLISILSSLSTSATEINQWEKEEVLSPCHLKQQRIARGNEKTSKLKNSRSNSFDVSTLQPSEIPSKILEATSRPYQAASNWFIKRHEPKSRIPLVEPSGKKVVRKEPGKVMWDRNRGSIVSAQALGSAIEGFLTQSTPESPNKEKNIPNKGTKLSDRVLGAANKVLGVANRANNWFSKTEEESADACDSSLCSALKDLFVK